MHENYPRVVVFARSETGRVQKNNQDAFLVSDLAGSPVTEAMPKPVELVVKDRGVLLAVSDGMNGALAGVLASTLVLYSFRRGMSTIHASSVEAALIESIEKTNRDIWTTAQTKGREGMGATLSAILFFNNNGYIVEIGGSRTYLLRGGQVFQLSHDQSAAHQLLERGEITKEQLLSSGLDIELIQSMGSRPEVTVSLGRLPLRKKDRFLLCSDGLSKQLSDSDVQSTIEDAPSLQIASTRLIDLAIERGGIDNITVVLGEIDGENLPPLSEEDMTSRDPAKVFFRSQPDHIQ